MIGKGFPPLPPAHPRPHLPPARRRAGQIILGSQGGSTLLILRTLGSLDLLDADQTEITPVLSQPKRLAILVYLSCALPRRFHRRDSLLALFWPERDAASARNALSQSLSFLRSHLPPDFIVGRGTEEIGVVEPSFRTDVEEFQTALSEGRWADALEVYRGEFLPGFHLGNSEGFGEWMEAERERLRESAAGAAWALAHLQILQGNPLEAERTAQRAFGLVWSDESPVREFMRAMAAAGDRVAALNFYERFRQKIDLELEVAPSAETQELADTIRSGDLPRAASVPPADSRFHPPPGGPGEHILPSAMEAVAGSGPWKLWFWSLALTAAVCFAAVGALRIHWTLTASEPPPEDRPFTVLAEVEGTAPPEIREAAAFMLRTGLDMAHVVQTVPVSEVERILKLLDRSPDSPVDPTLARTVATRLGVSTVALPRLDRLGEQYVLGLRVEDVGEGLLQAEGHGLALDESHLVDVLDEVLRQVRRRLGETRAVLATAQPLPQVLTPSLEALQEFRLAREDGAGQARLAVAHLRRAVALDTAFAMAWQLMASYYGNYLNRPDSAELASRQAGRFLDRLTTARRLDLELHRRMREDVALWDVALEEAEEAVRRDPRYLNNYGVYIGYPGGLPDSALNIRFRLERGGAENAHRFNRDLPYETRCFINTHYLAAALDRVDEWLALMDTLAIHVPPDCRREAALFEHLAAANWTMVDSMLRAGPGDWRWPTVVETALLQMVPLRGRIHEAYRTPTLQRPETRAVRPDSSGLSNISHLLLQVAYGLPLEEGPEETFKRRGEPKDLEGRGWSVVRDYVLYGVRESLVGDSSEARRVATRLQAMRDSATSRTFESAFEPWFVLLDVGPAFQRGDWPLVIETLTPMVARIHEPHVGGLGGDDFLCWWLLAEAHIQLGDLHSGIGYLESILTRPRFRRENWMLQGFIHPAARFKLADLYARVGDTPAAREQYRSFLETFTDPDPEFRWMVEEARDRLTRSPGFPPIPR